MPTFVLNDDSKVNSYGFKVSNEGIDLSRFLANPVMLDQHWNSTSAVIGKWKNIRIEGSKLLADADFDEADETAKKISGKVARGIITGASMGISFDREEMKQQPDGTWVLTRSELFEASIVAIPSNANALRLYAGEELMPQSAILLCISNLQKTFEHKKSEMKKIALSIAALAAIGFTAQPNEDEVSALSAAIEGLKAKYDAEKTARETLQKQLETQLDERVKVLVGDAVAAGKITASVKEDFEKMAKADYALAAKVIAGMPTKSSLAGKVGNTEAVSVKTVDDFAALSYQEQVAWKSANPDAYKKLFA